MGAVDPKNSIHRGYLTKVLHYNKWSLIPLQPTDGSSCVGLWSRLRRWGCFLRGSSRRRWSFNQHLWDFLAGISPPLKLRFRIAMIGSGYIDGPTWWRNQWAVSNRLVSWSSGGSPASMFEAHATAEVYRECIYVIESWNCSIHVARKASYSRSTESWFYDTSNIFQLSMGQNDQPWSIQKNGWFNPGLIETTTHRMVFSGSKIGRNRCHLCRFERSRFALRMLHALPGFDVGWPHAADGACIEHYYPLVN